MKRATGRHNRQFVPLMETDSEHDIKSVMQLTYQAFNERFDFTQRGVPFGNNE